MFGHSYGSLVSGIALQDGASSLVDNAVLYGSPGFGASSTAQLGMNDHNFFVMTTPDDYLARGAGLVAPLHGWGSNPNEIIGGVPNVISGVPVLPEEPARYRFPQLDTGAGSVNLGGQEISKVGASGHSQYSQDPLERMTGYNLAAILLGRADLAKKDHPALMAPPRTVTTQQRLAVLMVVGVLTAPMGGCTIMYPKVETMYKALNGPDDGQPLTDEQKIQLIDSMRNKGSFEAGPGASHQHRPSDRRAHQRRRTRPNLEIHRRPQHTRVQPKRRAV